MGIASERPRNASLGGAATASNETPVSSAEQPDPPPGANTEATRPERPGPGSAGGPEAKEDYRDAHGRDHPALSENDHSHQRLHGETARQIEKDDRKPEGSPSQTEGVGSSGSGRDQQQARPPEDGPEGGARRSNFDPDALTPPTSNGGAHHKRPPRGG